VIKLTNRNEESYSKRSVELLQELVKWTKVTSIPQVKKLLLDTLTTDEYKVAYENSDGEKNTRDIAAIVHKGHNTVASWWKSWIRLGIAESVSAHRGPRAKRLFSLEDFGITLPVLQVESPADEENQSEEINDE